jgi:mannobiose 2-epimerase
VTDEAVSVHEIDNYMAAARDELLNNILPYWEHYAPDEERGGFQGRVNRYGKADAGAGRGALLSSRILWTFSAAYRHTGDPACLDMARRAYEDLETTFADKKNGGFYWAVSADSVPRDPRKIIYGQAFGIYALSEYFRATGDKTALEKAIALYRLVEEKARDKTNGGYFEEFSSDWRILDARGFGRSAIGASGQKSQNAHIHILEAYTNLFRVWPDEGLKQDLGALQDVLLDRILDPKTQHLILFLNNDWTPIGDDVSYGHDIEFSWLLVESAEVLGDEARLERAKTAAVKMARATIREGLDGDGGLFNEGNAKGISDTNKDWWPQAEATVGFLNAWQITGEARFFRHSRRAWDFLDTYLVDHRDGEWFRAVDRHGSVVGNTDKIGFWKCPYHNSRACMELIDRLEKGKQSLNSGK